MRARLGIALLLAGLIGLAGCNTLGGNPPSMEDWIALMKAHNSSGCAYVVGTYPPFAQALIYAEWGEHPKDACRSFQP